MLEQFTLPVFTEQLGTCFTVRLSPDLTVPLALTAAEDAGSTPTQEQFALTFRGPLDRFLPQQTYEMEHERLGTFALFFTVIGKDQGGFLYQAVFNRFIN